MTLEPAKLSLSPCRCGYDRSGLPAESVCPECGAAPDRATVYHRLSRARASYIQLVLLLVALSVPTPLLVLVVAVSQPLTTRRTMMKDLLPLLSLGTVCAVIFALLLLAALRLPRRDGRETRCLWGGVAMSIMAYPMLLEMVRDVNQTLVLHPVLFSIADFIQWPGGWVAPSVGVIGLAGLTWHATVPLTVLGAQGVTTGLRWGIAVAGAVSAITIGLIGLSGRAAADNQLAAAMAAFAQFLLLAAMVGSTVRARVLIRRAVAEGAA